MISLLQSIILGAVQGVSELFPVSSLGHSVILPAIFGWNINEQNPDFLIFLVALHLATAIVLFLFYWKEWMQIIGAFFTSLTKRKIHNDHAKLAWLLIVSTIPAGLIGLLFQTKIQEHFISPISAAFFLMINGVLLIAAQLLRKRSGKLRIVDLSWGKGLIIGTMQAIALIPGFSRTGASLSGGLVSGLSNEDALRFSFLLATPIIGAAALLKIPQLFATHDTHFMLVTLAGSLAAALFAYISAKFLTKYFELERHSLYPFAVYCILAGLAALIYIG